VIKYTATFADGTVVKRSSEREYSHCWRVQYTNRSTHDVLDHSRGKARDYTGFAGRLDLAEAAIRGATADSKYGKHPADRSTIRTEIVPAVKS
jgi:hypothetical protein